MNYGKETIMVLTRSVPPAFASASIYRERLSGRYRLVFVEEQANSASKIIAFIKKRLRKKGFWSLLDLILLRIFMVFQAGEAISRDYQPALTVQDINAEEVIELIRKERPALIIANICSLLNVATLKTIAEIGSKAINLHNGINPRYRGSGNFWAIYENNFDFIGFTVHYVDAGIDTGERIHIGTLDFRGVDFNNFEIHTFREGAKQVVSYILDGSYSIDPRFIGIRSCHYPLPGLSHYLRVRQKYLDYQTNEVNIEQSWQDNFSKSAIDANRTHFQKMEWIDELTVETRDNLVRKIYDGLAVVTPVVADIGCGDGRYMNMLPGYSRYIGFDYSLRTIQLGARFLKATSTGETGLPLKEQRSPELKMWQDGNRFLVEGSACSLPLSNDSVDITLSIGLLQHIAKSQQAVDELYRITRSGGYIVINTLRQFSKLELALIIMGSLFNGNRLKLALTIFRKDYFRGIRVDGTLVAVRYGKDELMQKLRIGASKCTVYYNGIAGSRFFARELTLVAEKQVRESRRC